MEFRLIYEGKLKSNADAKEKHRIRKIFHEQFKTLWTLPPLNDQPDWIALELTDKTSFTSVKQIEGRNFASLVCKEMHMYCELSLLILKPDVKQLFGDIDNKLKTIFDALRCPNSKQEIPKDWEQSDSDDPLICLMDDDSLISKIIVDVDRLLEPEADQNVVIINVKIKGTQVTFGNMSLII
jgi:hypothetical protein